MSNLLTGLAMALGGGLKGYMQGKELQRQQILEDEDRKRREAMDRRREEMENARMFQDGFVPHGSMSAQDQGAMTPGTQDAVMKSIEAALAMGRGFTGMPEAAPKLGDATETPWKMAQRQYTPVPGTNLDFDVTKGQDWQDTLSVERQVGQERRQRATAQAQEDRQRFMQAQREREMAGLFEQAAKGDQTAIAQLRSMGANTGDLSPIPGTQAAKNWETFKANLHDRQSSGYNGMVVQTDQGSALVDPRTGAVRLLTMPDGSTMQPRPAATAQRKIPSSTSMKLSEYATLDQTTSNAIAAMEQAMAGGKNPTGPIKGRMSAVMDPLGMLSDEEMQSQGGLALVASEIRRMMSGGQIPEDEAKYLDRFIPSRNLDERSALKKLHDLRTWLAARRMQALDDLEMSGYDVSGFQRPAMPAPSAPQGDELEQNFQRQTGGR